MSVVSGRMALIDCAIATLTVLALAGCAPPKHLDPPLAPPPEPVDLRAHLYVLSLAVEPGRADKSGPLIHSTFVNGHDYAGMEDNDLRGFLDGSVRWGWNQVSQIHTRVGRRASRGRQEPELFRNLYKWEDVRLPAMSTVETASMSLHIEYGSEHPMSLYLYPLRGDYRPGRGGVERNNNSAPASAEVWWQDRAAEQTPWGLPGASAAAGQWGEQGSMRAHGAAGADTYAMPLAAVEYTPGDQVLTLMSPRMAEYLQFRLERRGPMNLLLKASDYHEDLPGRRLTVFSGDEGDGIAIQRRPALKVSWRPHASSVLWQQALWLEHGRRYTSDVVALADAPAAVVVDANRPARLQVRGYTADNKVTDWRPLTSGQTLPWIKVQFRVAALTNPISLDETFTASITDTWVTTGPPEKQAVQWRFRSPAGVIHRTTATYQGGNTWQVTFAPDQLGRWRYDWSANFTESPFAGTPGVFDVHAEDADDLARALALMHAQLDADGAGEDTRLIKQLIDVQRAALHVRQYDPQVDLGWSEIGAELARLRAVLADKH